MTFRVVDLMVDVSRDERIPIALRGCTFVTAAPKPPPPPPPPKPQRPRPPGDAAASHAAFDELAVLRAELLRAMAQECGSTVVEKAANPC